MASAVMAGNGINRQATDTAGLLVGYRYRFNEWAAADASYGYARNTERNFSPAGVGNVESNVHEFTGAFVLTVRYRLFQLRPYVLAGSGALDFRPRNNRAGYVSGAQAQARPVFLYGGRTDYDLTKHLMVRLEYRGFVYQPPDFQMLAFNSGGTTHMAQPSGRHCLQVLTHN